MANVVFKIGSLDLSNFLRIAPDQGFNPGAGDMLEPAFSDSPLFEGQVLTSLHAKNKEMMFPLFLHPPTAPYTQDALNLLIQQVNQAIRPIIDQGALVYAQWQNAQASNPTFFSVQFARFEPNFNFRISEKGWLAGMLHLWVLPYGHTATERTLGTYSAPVNQSGLVIPPASLIAAGGSIVGDAPPQYDIRTTVGSYLADDGRIGILAALSTPSYIPIIPVASFFNLVSENGASGFVFGASGAWASQFLAMNSFSASAGGVGGDVQLDNEFAGGQFSFAFSPGSVYAGDNRLLGLVRARQEPFGLRAFGPTGDPVGPTVVASSLDGWQIVDYGIVRVPPWAATGVITVKAFNGFLGHGASGMVSPYRSAPAWRYEHGPCFLLPNDNSVISLDFESPAVAIDGFDGASGAALGVDQLGNQWRTDFGVLTYNGNSQLVTATAAHITMPPGVNGDGESEVVFTVVGSTVQTLALGGGLFDPKNHAFSFSGGGSIAVIPVPGVYAIKLTQRGVKVWGSLAGPSGAFAGTASGAVASVGNGIITNSPPIFVGGFQLQTNATSGISGGILIESFRARGLASTGIQSRDILHLNQPLAQNTRMTPSAIDTVDLQARQRGPIQALSLPAPSLGAGLFVMSQPFDQGPANDLLNVDVRARERFTYAR